MEYIPETQSKLQTLTEVFTSYCTTEVVGLESYDLTHVRLETYLTNTDKRLSLTLLWYS